MTIQVAMAVDVVMLKANGIVKRDDVGTVLAAKVARRRSQVMIAFRDACEGLAAFPTSDGTLRSLVLDVVVGKLRDGRKSLTTRSTLERKMLADRDPVPWIALSLDGYLLLLARSAVV